MTTANLIVLLIGIIEPALSAAGVIPAQYQNLANGVLGAITALKNELTGTNGQFNVTAVTLMQGITSALQVLQVQGALPGQSAGLILAFSTAATAGATAYSQAAAKVDPTLLQPIAQIPLAPAATPAKA